MTMRGAWLTGIVLVTIGAAVVAAAALADEPDVYADLGILCAVWMACVSWLTAAYLRARGEGSRGVEVALVHDRAFRERGPAAPDAETRRLIVEDPRD